MGVYDYEIAILRAVNGWTIKYRGEVTYFPNIESVTRWLARTMPEIEEKVKQMKAANG